MIRLGNLILPTVLSVNDKNIRVTLRIPDETSHVKYISHTDKCLYGEFHKGSQKIQRKQS
jgi:hypothetical protein